MNKTFFYFALLIVPVALPAAPLLDLKGAEATIQLGNFADVLEDPGGKLTIGDVSSARYAETLELAEDETTRSTLDRLRAEGKSVFVRNDSSRPSFGFSSSAFWFRFRLKAVPAGERKSSMENRLLEIGYTSLDYIWMYFPREGDPTGNPDSDYWKFEGGDKYPFSVRQFNYKHVVFEIPEFTGEREVYLRIQTSGTADMPLVLQTSKAFTDKVVNNQYGYGLYFGIMLVMVLYNLFIYFSTRDLSYLYYVIFIAGNTLFLMNLRGYAFQYLWPENIWWGHQSASFFMGFFAFFGFQFARVFLNTRENTPILDRMIRGLMVFDIGIIVASLIGLPHQIMARLMVLGASSFVLFSAFVGFRRFFSGFRPARFFMIAFSVFFLGGVIGSLARVSALPFNFVTEHADQIGFAIQVILLSLGLADRINTMKKEKEQAQAELLKSRKIMLDSFARFVPKQFLNFLGHDSIVDVGLGDAVQKDFTVLFTDIRGFTTLSESMTANENFMFLNSYLKRMGPLIHLNGGFIDKFIGDAIMALFPETAADALTAAVDMRRELVDYNSHRTQKGFDQVSMGIGLHSGGLMLGTVGSSSRLDTTVIGDTVNLASRLESMTKTFKISIILSDSVYTLLPDKSQFNLRELDTVRVKGRHHPVVVYEAFDADAPGVLEKKREGLSRFSEALHNYKIGDFTGAKRIFEELVGACPEDATAAMYSRRCDKLLENPPGPNWKGVSRMALK